MARNTRIRNVGRESINLYPFQILLERNEEVVAEITPSEFLTQFGGTNNSVLNNLSISPTGDAPTVTKASSGGGGVTTFVSSIAGNGAGSSSMPWPGASGDYTAFVSTATSQNWIQLPTIDATTEGLLYIVKDGAGVAATHTISVYPAWASGQTIDGFPSPVVISSNFGSLSFIGKGSAWYIV